MTTTSAVHTSAGGAALAVTFSPSSLNVHDNGADKAAYQQRGKKKNYHQPRPKIEPPKKSQGISIDFNLKLYSLALKLCRV